MHCRLVDGNHCVPFFLMVRELLLDPDVELACSLKTMVLINRSIWNHIQEDIIFTVTATKIPISQRSKIFSSVNCIRLHDFYSSPSIIRIMKLRRMRWTGHVARMGAKRNAYRLLVGKPEG
jgi:hypothetical protein